MEDGPFIDALFRLITDNAATSTIIGAVVSFLAVSGVFAFRRRSKSVSQGDALYFADEKLLEPPIARPAYSDRMAYVLAEMSALAYYQFEGSGEMLRDAARRFLQLSMKDEENIEQWLEQVADELLIKGVDSIAFFERILSAADYKLLATVNIEETQCFICRQHDKNKAPYIVVAFRGTEKKVSDWLTDANAVPYPNMEPIKVHKGFLRALRDKKDKNGKNVLSIIQDALIKTNAKDENGDMLPVFFTGHSLGGALALLTTRELAPDINGACYTFGGPRVANYEYFGNMKTPVFRVVNSADIVPRVPPGAGMSLMLKLVQFFSSIATLVPPVSKALERVEEFLDKLNGYRHFGDQRYLTDVKSGRFETVQLLSNPPVIDRIFWMWQHLAASFFAAVKSHGMAVYRKKLQYLANSRN